MTTIAINDINEAPTSLDISAADVAENQAVGAVVGDISVSDPDIGDIHTLTLLSDAGGRFALDGASLIVNGPLDFEATPSHDVEIRATDAAGVSIDRSFTITVNDANDAPTNLTLDNSNIDENSANGSVIGALSVMDQDPADTHVYSLIDDAGGLFALDGAALVVSGPLDFEAQNSHSVTIRATDTAGDSVGQTFDVFLNDVVESFVGTAAADVITGDAGDNDIQGLAGDDTLDGAGGNDTLLGGEGQDQLTLGTGTDQAVGAVSDFFGDVILICQQTMNWSFLTSISIVRRQIFRLPRHGCPLISMQTVPLMGHSPCTATSVVANSWLWARRAKPR